MKSISSNGFLVKYTDNFNKKHITYLKTLSEIKALEFYFGKAQVSYEPTILPKITIDNEIKTLFEI